MIDVIKKSDLESHIIHEGCDKGCGYIDERDLDNIHVFNTYTQDEVIAMLAELQQKIDIMSDTVVEGRTTTITSWIGMKKRICKLIQSKIDKLKGGENGNPNM